MTEKEIIEKEIQKILKKLAEKVAKQMVESSIKNFGSPHLYEKSKREILRKAQAEVKKLEKKHNITIDFSFK